MKQLVELHDPLCVAVVDAGDFEGSLPSRRDVREILGGEQRRVVLAVNKADRLPRLDDRVLEFLRHRFDSRFPVSCVDVHAVSPSTGDGIAELAERALSSSGDVLLLGTEGTGKSALVQALAAHIRGADGGEEAASVASRPRDRDVDRHAAAVERLRCFSDAPERALWDTPGLPRERNLQQRLPPALASLLLGASTRHEAIEMPARVSAQPGESVVLMIPSSLDAPVDGTSPAPPIPIARVDVLVPNVPTAAAAASDPKKADGDGETAPAEGEAVPAAGGGFVQVAAFLPPCVTLDVLPTAEAPDAMVLSDALMSSEAFVRAARRRPKPGRADSAASVAATTPFEEYRVSSRRENSVEGGREPGGVNAIEWKRERTFGVDLTLAGVTATPRIEPPGTIPRAPRIHPESPEDHPRPRPRGREPTSV